MRSKKVLSDEHRIVELSVVSFASTPIDRLMAQLQWLDSRGKALLDCTSRRSPIVECAVSVSQMLRGRGGPTGALLQHLGYDAHLVRRLRAVLLSMATQLEWRFEAFKHWPFLFAALFDGRPPREQDKLLTEFFHANACDLDVDFEGKIRKLYSTTEDLKSDRAFMHGLRAWAETHKVCNMHLERLLARIRDGMGPGKSPQAERACAGGFLSQVLRDHLALGGRDPRHQSRESLLSHGAPLAGKRRAVGKSKPASGFIIFKGDKQKQRRAVHGRLDKKVLSSVG